MNIGILIWNYETGVGGLEKSACGQAAFLAGRGHTVHVFHNRLEEDPLIVPACRHPEAFCHNLALRRESPDLNRARALIRQQNLDVFVAHFSWFDFMWVPPLLHGAGLPLVYAEHNVPSVIQSERWNKNEHLACASAADRIVLLLDEYREQYPAFLQERIRIIPNAVAAAEKHAAPESPRGGAFTLLAAGRFVEHHKQFSLLVRAFAALAPAFPDWRLRLCGGGPDGPGYRELAESLGITDRVSFPGMVADMASEYATANLFCVPSKFEGFGLVTVEAQSHGLPVVGFAGCPGTNSLVRHETNGLLAPEMTAESLAATLLPLMRNHKLRGLMGRNARKDAERFAPERVHGQWETLLAEVAADTKAPLLDFPLDRSDAAKADLVLRTVLLRANPFAPQSLFGKPGGFSSTQS